MLGKATQIEELADGLDEAVGLLQALRADGLEPSRIVSDPEGGVAVYVFSSEVLESGSHTRYARLSRTEEGEVVGLLVDRSDKMHEAWAIESGELESAVERMRAFVASAGMSAMYPHRSAAPERTMSQKQDIEMMVVSKTRTEREVGRPVEFAKAMARILRDVDEDE
jgi:hypothetical protein